MNLKGINDIDLYDSKEINFIKIFFRILLVFTVLVALCMFIIPVSDSITYKKGEIVSNNPEIDYKAPFEIIPQETFVRKGDAVKKGDTLLYITNAGLGKDFSTTQGEYSTLSQQTKTIDIDKLNINDKITFLEKEKGLAASQYKNNRSKTYSELNGINRKLKLLKEQEQLKFRKLSTDSLMYSKEVISLVDLNRSRDEYLSIRNEVLGSQNIASQLRIQVKTLANEYQQKANALDIQISDLTATQGRLAQQQENVNTKLETQEKSINFIQSELDRQYVISDIDGVVSSIFNETQNFNFINKGESLVSVAPNEETFYARAKVDEQDLKYIKVGQTAHLKLDAYYYYQYGAIKGMVSYIPDRKDKNNEFFVLIELPEDQKLNLRSGYSVKGEIILDKMRLGQFIIKKLFEKYDSQISAEKPKTKVVTS